MTPSEIRAKETKELVKLVEEKRTALFGLKLQQVTGQLAKLADIGKARKDIARMLTGMREREMGIGAKEGLGTMDHGLLTEETTKKKTKTIKTTKTKTGKTKK